MKQFFKWGAIGIASLALLLWFCFYLDLETQRWALLGAGIGCLIHLVGKKADEQGALTREMVMRITPQIQDLSSQIFRLEQQIKELKRKDV